MILTHLVLFSFLAGAGGGAAAPAETFSGGWAVSRLERETETDRKARIKAERIRLGILPAEPSQPSQPGAVEAAGATIEGGAAILALRVRPAFGVRTYVPPDPGLAVDLAELYAGAWLDQEIKRHFELLDDEDTAMLLIAIATLH